MLSHIKKIFSLSDDTPSISEDYPKFENKQPSKTDYSNLKVSDNLNENKLSINNIFDKCLDLLVTELKPINSCNLNGMIVYINNLVDKDLLTKFVINKLTSEQMNCDYSSNSKEYYKYLLGIRDDDIYSGMKNIIQETLNGKVALFIDGLSVAMIIDINNPPSRTVEESQSEATLHGPREGFTESIATNIALIRKKIKSTELKIESFTIGKETNTTINILYLSNKANGAIVNELKERLNNITLDSVLDSNYIKEYIEDERLGIFPTVYSSEKADIIASKILSGRIAILVDGTPTALTIPAVFFEFLITTEDYYLRFIPGTINRWLRYICFLLAIALPAFYVALITFHVELIPIALVISIIKTRSFIPYPPWFECFLMLSVYEILRETGVRMPKTVGQAISVVGPLVLGQAAVEAGLASTPMIIVVSLTALSAFAIPSTDMNSMLIFPRFMFLIISAMFGLLGLSCSLAIILIKLGSIRSFSIPYLEPLSPWVKSELPNVVGRPPIWKRFKQLLVSNRNKL